MNITLWILQCKLLFFSFSIFDASVFFQCEMFNSPFSFLQNATIHFFILNLVALIFFRLSVSFFALSFVTLSFSFTPFFLCKAYRVQRYMRFSSPCLYSYSSFHCNEDCRAISVGSDVMRKMHYPRALDRIMCIRGVCISTMTYTGTVYIRCKCIIADRICLHFVSSMAPCMSPSINNVTHPV